MDLVPYVQAPVPLTGDVPSLAAAMERELRRISANLVDVTSGVNVPYPRTAAEIAALVTPTDFSYPELNILRYGAVGNDSTDNVTAFTNTQAVAAQYASPPPIIFPAGIYRIASAQNWFKSGLTLQAQGYVVIKGTGASGNVMTFDAGIGANGTHCFMLGDWNLDSTNAGVTVGLYTRNVHHSKFEVAVRNVVTSAVQIDGAVLNHYKVTCSTNEGNMTTIPANGISINGSALITQTTDCFFDLILEGLTGGIGVNIGSAAGNIFIGTSEANATGVLIPAHPNGFNNTFINFDCEANTTLDYDVAGRGNTFLNCLAGSLLNPGSIWRSTAASNNWIGGTLSASGTNPAVTVTAGALNNCFTQFYCTTSISDSGTNTTIWGEQVFITTDTKILLPNLKVTNRLGVNGNTPPAQVTGFGTPTGTGVIANFPGATATLAQCSQAIAQIIKDLKAIGFYGA